MRNIDDKEYKGGVTEIEVTYVVAGSQYVNTPTATPPLIPIIHYTCPPSYFVTKNFKSVQNLIGLSL